VFDAPADDQADDVIIDVSGDGTEQPI
jgi:hypothetical protein